MKPFVIKVIAHKLKDATGQLKAHKDGTFTLCIDPTQSLEIQTKTFFHEATHIFARYLTDMCIAGKSTKPLNFMLDGLEKEEIICKDVEQSVWHCFKILQRK